MDFDIFSADAFYITYFICKMNFAEKMQTTQQRVSEWECDKVEPSLYNIIKILDILEIDFEELIDGNEDK